MVRSAFLLASKRVLQVAGSDDKQPVGASAKLNLLEEDDESAALLEYDLAAAKEVCLPGRHDVFPD